MGAFIETVVRRRTALESALLGVLSFGIWRVLVSINRELIPMRYTVSTFYFWTSIPFILCFPHQSSKHCFLPVVLQSSFSSEFFEISCSSWTCFVIRWEHFFNKFVILHVAPTFLFFLIDLFSVVGGLFRCLEALVYNNMVSLRSIELSFAAYLGWQVLSVA